MSDNLGYCGIDCGECMAMIATKKNDSKMKREVAENWSKQFGHPFKPEDINCVGCTTLKGPHIGHCNICGIRKCGLEKKVENCAYCPSYGCEQLVKFHGQVKAAKDNLERVRKKTAR